MALSFAQLTAKRAAIRQPGMGLPKTPGLKTFDRLMSDISASAAITTQPTPITPENNLGTINGDNLKRINDNNLVRIS